MTSLRGKRAVVVGGSSGVGKATVKVLISEGVRVTAVARGEDRLRARGIKAGTVRKGISTRKAAALVVAALEGIIGTAKTAQSMELLKQAGQGLFDYLDTLRP